MGCRWARLILLTGRDFPIRNALLFVGNNLKHIRITPEATPQVPPPESGSGDPSARPSFTLGDTGLQAFPGGPGEGLQEGGCHTRAHPAAWSLLRSPWRAVSPGRAHISDSPTRQQAAPGPVQTQTCSEGTRGARSHRWSLWQAGWAQGAGTPLWF